MGNMPYVRTAIGLRKVALGETWDLEREHYVRDNGNLSNGQPHTTCLALQRSNLQYCTAAAQTFDLSGTCQTEIHQTHFAEGILSYHSYVRLDIAVAGKRPFACPNLPVTTRAHHSMLPQDNPTISYRMNCLSGVYPTTRVVETLSQSVQQKRRSFPFVVFLQ